MVTASSAVLTLFILRDLCSWFTVFISCSFCSIQHGTRGRFLATSDRHGHPGDPIGPTLVESAGHLDRIALEIYSGVLPGWDIVGIDVSAFSHLNGALHCLTCNIPSTVPVRKVTAAPGLIDPTPMDLAAGEPGMI